MAQTNVRAQMQQRRDTAADWTSENPILLSGEIGYETDTGKFKIGDGSTAWSSLDYLPIPDNSDELNGNLTVTGTLGVNSNATFDDKVGIGKSNPITPLDVNGSARIGAATGIASIDVGFGATEDRNAFIDFIGDTTYTGYGLRLIRTDEGANGRSRLLHRGTGDFDLNCVDAGAITFSVSGQEKLRIASNGNVGIGTTSPSSLLHIKSVGSAKTNVTLENSTTSTQKLVAGLTGENNLGFSIYDDLLSQTTFRIDNNGNVGIGTTSPTEKLEVAGNVILDANNAKLNIKSGVGGTTGALNFTFNTNSTVFGTLDLSYDTRATTGLRLWSDYPLTLETDATTLPIVFNQGASERLRIANGGNVGIGTSSPSYQLQLSTDSAGKPSTNTWTIVSDERIKEEIELADLDLCYEAVKNIPLKRFKWKDEVYTEEQAYDRRKLGWIAQDVEAVFPKAVRQHEFKYNQVFEEVVIPAVAEELDDDGNIVTEVQPERIEKGELISEDIIEDCRDLNSDQIYAAMYGAIQKLISKVESLEAKVASLEAS